MLLLPRFRRLFLLAPFAATALVSAEDSDNPPANAAPVGDVTTLDRYVVEGVPLEQSFNPLTRQTGAVMGDDRGPLDTPRAVSTITAGLLNERAIHGLADILEYSPGAYAPSSYGELTVPYIRGDVAESYVNGQRRTNNLYGFLPSFNGVEAVDVVRGAGSAVFGAGYLTGGYVNYQTKEPQFTPQTTVTARLGTWTVDGLSYLNESLQIDTTAPINNQLAWRLSYEGKGGDTFYQRNGDKDDREDLFGALTWRPHPGFKLDFNAQWMWQNTNETLGVNRVNQDLIDHDLYYTGLSADDPYNPGPIPATSAVKLPWDATLLSKGDFAEAHVANAQLIATLEVSPDLTIINRTFAEHVNRERVYATAYLEFVRQNTFENRTEFHLKTDALGLPQSIVTGAAVRLQQVLSFENYTNEYLYNFDITDPSRVFDQAAQFPSSFFPGTPGPGGFEFFSPLDPYVPTPETGDSRVWNPALFLQDDVTLTKRVHLMWGARYDAFYARARDPLPAAGTTPASATANANAGSGDVSLMFRATPGSSYYITAQSTTSLHGNLGGGGISLQSDGTIDPNDLRNRSELLELGAKYSLAANQLFVGADAFDQKRSRTGLGDVHDDIEVRGIELEAVYQPDTRFSATFNATFQDGKYIDASPYQLGGRDIYAGYAAGRGPGGQGTGDDSYSPFGDQVPVGDWPLLGFSHVMLNGSVRYRWTNGFGLALDGQWQSRQRGNIDDQWHIPDQYTLNASISWQHGPWLVDVDILNLTNQHNWIHNGDPYTASILVLPELPLRAEGYVKYRF
ncbi:MAG TPA: TonB-dependent receptor plug domain-containing protein [Candidatus Didemnitutus sp.]|nr:TonB-dependent receptor plug domain-containing protein [Candidatus Didemnitutus sp.]